MEFLSQFEKRFLFGNLECYESGMPSKADQLSWVKTLAEKGISQSFSILFNLCWLFWSFCFIEFKRIETWQQPASYTVTVKHSDYHYDILALKNNDSSNDIYINTNTLYKIAISFITCMAAHFKKRWNRFHDSWLQFVKLQY